MKHYKPEGALNHNDSLGQFYCKCHKTNAISNNQPTIWSIISTYDAIIDLSTLLSAARTKWRLTILS